MATPLPRISRLAGGGRLLGAVGLLLVVAMLLYHALGHGLLERLHAGGGSALAERVHARITHLPLDYVCARADALVSAAYRAVAAVWTLGVLGWLLAAGHLQARRVSAGEGTLLAGASLWLVAPWLPLKLAGLLLASSPWWRWPQPVRVPAAPMQLFWLLVFAFAYLCAPYGWLPASIGGRLAGVILLPLAGWWWARGAAAALVLPAPRAHGLNGPMLTLSALLLAAGWRVLHAGLSWKGDEDYHIMQVVHLCETLVPLWFVVAGFGVVVLARTDYNTPRAVRIVQGAVLAVAVVAGAGYLHLFGSLVRYPYALRWLQALPLQTLFPAPALFYQEALFRLTGGLGVLATAGVAMAMVPSCSPGLRVAVGLAVATLPIFQFYGGTLCLETPAVALMAPVCARAGIVLESDAQTLRADPVWPALLLLGFLKETTLPIILLLIAFRLALQWRRDHSRAHRQRELTLALVAVAPILIYLVFRALNQPRGHAGLWHQWWRPDLWGTLLGAWWEQLGWLVVAAPVGLGVWARERSRPVALALLAWCGGVSLFFLADYPAYIGFSRFTLMVLPPLLVASVALLVRVAAFRPALAWLLLVGALVANIGLSPLRPDGSYAVQWGSPRSASAELRYPYREVVTWLHDADPAGRVLFAGTDYPFYLTFYFNRLQWAPDYEQSLALRSAGEALYYGRRHRFKWVVVHVESGRVAAAGDSHYRLETVFASEAGVLSVYVARVDQSGFSRTTSSRVANSQGNGLQSRSSPRSSGSAASGYN